MAFGEGFTRDDSSYRPQSWRSGRSVRHLITMSDRKFDVTTLPDDMLRVYRALEERFDEEYALLFVFNMRTAIELHRAWHMTLLTSKILQRVKDEFKLRMTWNLGVVRLKFRVEDGGFELHRKVPYDYDSEFQDLYMRIAKALAERHITVHEALIFQTEAKQGKLTARSGLFLRNFPGRLLLYPALASTCSVIFFNGSWRDAYVAAICGITTGLFDYALCKIGGEVKILIDFFVGMMTGIIGSLFWTHNGENYCLSSIFLGTLYWFFYGTAFVIGLLEIMAGELETGVTRFVAVSIKTFVLCLSASFGMLMVLEAPADVWQEQNDYCDNSVDDKWWRIPLYLACSASALGQYRFPVVDCWRGLIVQLVAYVVQYETAQAFVRRSASKYDNIDTMSSNILGAMAAVVTACALSYVIDLVMKAYYGQLLQRDEHREETPSVFDDCLYACLAGKVRCCNKAGVDRKVELDKLELERKLKRATDELRNPNHPRQEIRLEPHEEDLLLDTIVHAESVNIWAMLMPAVYQLVPGSMIAKLWFNIIFPPPPDNFIANNVFANLMVISASLALGLILGFFVVQTGSLLFSALAWWEPDHVKEGWKTQRDMRTGMYTMAKDENDDPETEDDKLSVVEEEPVEGEPAAEEGGGDSP